MKPKIDTFVHFLERSPTVFHAAKEITNRLAEAGFTPLLETEKWELRSGEGYFVMREHTLVAAFRVPQKTLTSSVILASHIDSPSLKIKPLSESSHHGIGQFGVDTYGAPLLHTWLDRPLYLAGRLSVLDGDGSIQSLLVSLDEYPVIIPGLAIHLDRSVTEKGLVLSKQEHLKPIFTLNAKKKHLEDFLHKQASFEKLLSFDLFLTPLEKPSFVGFENEILSASHLDNLASAWACLYGMMNAKVSHHMLQMAFFWDHEEIGSQTLSGADSVLADQLLERITTVLGLKREDFFRLKSESICLSLDVAHGFHPNYAEKYEPHHSCQLGSGVALKFSANQKYANSAHTSAAMMQLAHKKQLEIQQFVSRSDIPTGSTVGSMMASTLGIPTVDLGIGLWSMHSIRESIAVQDEIDLMQLCVGALEEER